MKRAAIFALSMGALILFGPFARASVVFSLDQATYTVAPGGHVDIPVYLSVNGTEFTELQAGDGLLSAGLRFLRTSGNATIASSSSITPNAADFTDPGPTMSWISGSDVRLLENVDIFTAISGAMGTVSGNSSRIYLGSFDVTAPNVGGTTSTFIATHYPSASEIITFGSGPGDTQNIYTLDPTSDTTVTIQTTQGVPEPATLGLTLAGALGLLMRRSGKSGRRMPGSDVDHAG